MHVVHMRRFWQLCQFRQFLIKMGCHFSLFPSLPLSHSLYLLLLSPSPYLPLFLSPPLTPSLSPGLLFSASVTVSVSLCLCLSVSLSLSPLSLLDWGEALTIIMLLALQLGAYVRGKERSVMCKEEKVFTVHVCVWNNKGCRKTLEARINQAVLLDVEGWCEDLFWNDFHI